MNYVHSLAAPTSWWIEQRKFYIENGVAGKSPIVVLDRSIYRTFIGRWHASLRKKDDNGAFTAVCTHDSEALIYPGKKMPKSVNIVIVF
jgi:hypothetical protein